MSWDLRLYLDSDTANARIYLTKHVEKTVMDQTAGHTCFGQLESTRQYRLGACRVLLDGTTREAEFCFPLAMQVLQS